MRLAVFTQATIHYELTAINGSGNSKRFDFFLKALPMHLILVCVRAYVVANLLPAQSRKRIGFIKGLFTLCLKLY